LRNAQSELHNITMQRRAKFFFFFVVFFVFFIDKLMKTEMIVFESRRNFTIFLRKQKVASLTCGNKSQRQLISFILYLNPRNVFNKLRSVT